MRLHDVRRSSLPWVIFGCLIAALILYHNRAQIAEEFYREFPPSVFGFSSQQQFQAQCSENCVNAVARGLIHAVISSLDPDSAPALELHIPFRSFQTLLEDQRRAIEAGQPVDPHTVIASIRHQGEFYRVRVRMKGELQDHWSEPGRMSLRIDVRDGRTIMDMESFSIHRPASRQHPYEPAFEEFARLNGALAPTYRYAAISVNGDDWGIWNIEERISPTLLEKQRRKNSLTLEFSMKDYWTYHRQTNNPYEDPTFRMKDARLFPNVFGDRKLRRDPVLRKQYSYVMRQVLSDGEDLLFDPSTLTRSIALAYMWGTNHVLLSGNTRFYLNPYTLMLEAIGSDQSWPQPIEKAGLVYPYVHPFRRHLESPYFRAHLPGAIEGLARNEDALDRIFGTYYGIFPNDDHPPLNAVHHNLARGRTNALADIEYLNRILPINRFVYLADSPDAVPPTPEQIAGLPMHVQARHYIDGTVEIFNLLDLPVKIAGIKSGFESLYNDLPLLEPKQRVVINSGWAGTYDNDIEVITELDGHRLVQNAGISLIPDNKAFNPLIRPTPAADMPPYVLENGNGYRIAQGSWNIDRPLVLQRPLTIEAGATLRFAPGTYLIVRGTLDVLGEKDLPARFEGQSGSWNGIYVLQADGRSSWSHAEVADTEALVAGALSLTGGVTFYRAGLDASHVLFDGTQAEDALNIVESDVQLRDIGINDTRSDAIDLDFCTGTIASVTMQNIGGDGLDISGSEIEFSQGNFTQVHDKAVSAGEASTLALHDITVAQGGVGIASKDGSHIRGSDITINGVTLAAIMSYQKKDFYDHPAVELDAVITDRPLIRQHGAGLVVNGKRVPGEELDVDALYQSSVMAK